MAQMPYEDAVAKAAKKHSAELELYVSESSNTLVSSKAGRQSCRDFTSQAGYAVRAISGARMGFASFDTWPEFGKSVATAIRLSHEQEKAPYGFASSARASSSAHFDPKAASMGAKEMLESLESMDGAHSSAKVSGITNLIGASASRSLLVTSQGARVEQKSTGFYAYSHCSAGGSEGDHANSSSRAFSPQPVAEVAARDAAAMRSPVKPSPSECEFVLDIRAIHDLFDLFLPFHFSGESARRRLTRLSPGFALMADGISLYDDPSIPGSENSAQYDDEGQKAQRMALAKSGKVVRFLYDMRNAALAGAKAHCNGLRASHSFAPSPSFSNISVEGGDIADAVAQCRRGVYVKSFLTSGANDVTGDFGFPLLTAFEIRGGETGRGLKGAVMRGNFFDVMRQAEFEKRRRDYGGVYSGRAAFPARLVA
ncbi:MAG: TldD/PmbA family protein [Candidatus Micrarchaeota archaeon]